MPTLARWHIRSAMLYFAAGFVLGGLMLAGKWLTLPPLIWQLRQVHVHFLLVGWITQLIIGVAYWMFPRLTKEEPRGSTAVAWVVFGLLNGGLLLRAVAEPAYTAWGGDRWGGLLALSALAQVTAGLLFVGNTWRRVRPFG